MYKQRQISNHTARIAQLFPAVLVTGPRQSGKSTLCQKLFQDHSMVLLDDQALLDLATNDPGLFIQNFPPPVIYDEIQRAGELFLAVKKYIDTSRSKEKGVFILSGSQPLTLIKAVSDSLAGRIGIVELLPMTYREIFELSPSPGLYELEERKLGKTNENPYQEKNTKSPIALESTIQSLMFRGGFPQMAIQKDSPEEADVVARLDSYIQTYLQKDLRELQLVKDLTVFEKYLRRFAMASGSIRSVSDIATDTGIPRATIQSWTSLLQASYLAKEVPAFAKRLGRREKKTSEQLLKSPIVGQIFETYAFHAFRSWLARDGVRPQFYHWRLDEQKEVDLVFEHQGGELVAVEFKLTARPQQADLVGIKAFQKNYPACKKAFLVTCFDQKMDMGNGIEHLPIGYF